MCVDPNRHGSTNMASALSPQVLSLITERSVPAECVQRGPEARGHPTPTAYGVLSCSERGLELDAASRTSHAFISLIMAAPGRMVFCSGSFPVHRLEPSAVLRGGKFVG